MQCSICCMLLMSCKKWVHGAWHQICYVCNVTDHLTTYWTTVCASHNITTTFALPLLCFLFITRYNNVRMSDFEYFNKLGEGGFGFVVSLKCVWCSELLHCFDSSRSCWEVIATDVWFFHSFNYFHTKEPKKLQNWIFKNYFLILLCAGALSQEVYWQTLRHEITGALCKYFGGVCC